MNNFSTAVYLILFPEEHPVINEHRKSFTKQLRPAGPTMVEDGGGGGLRLLHVKCSGCKRPLFGRRGGDRDEGEPMKRGST